MTYIAISFAPISSVICSPINAQLVKLRNVYRHRFALFTTQPPLSSVYASSHVPGSYARASLHTILASSGHFAVLGRSAWWSDAIHVVAEARLPLEKGMFGTDVLYTFGAISLTILLVGDPLAVTFCNLTLGPMAADNNNKAYLVHVTADGHLSVSSAPDCITFPLCTSRIHILLALRFCVSI